MQEREEQGSHGQAHGRVHDRAAGTECDSVRVTEREEEEKRMDSFNP